MKKPKAVIRNSVAIPLSEIAVVDRIRPIDQESAKAIAESIRQVGLLSPITVRSTPNANNGATPYTLVMGGHRLAAHVICGLETIEAYVTDVAGNEAQLAEIHENFFRRSLSHLERASHVCRMREIWEIKAGPIHVGRPKNNSAKFAEFYEGKFSEYVADRFGISKRAVEELDAVARKLHPTLWAGIKGTPAEDNMVLLKKAIKLSQEDQEKAAAALDYEPDLKKVLKFALPAPIKPDKSAVALKQFKAAWKMMDKETQRKALNSIGVDKLK